MLMHLLLDHQLASLISHPLIQVCRVSHLPVLSLVIRFHPNSPLLKLYAAFRVSQRSE